MTSCVTEGCQEVTCELAPILGKGLDSSAWLCRGVAGGRRIAMPDGREGEREGRRERASERASS